VKTATLLNKDDLCLVLGGRGFIGSHLVTRLLSEGYRVRCFDRPHVLPIGNSHLDNPSFELCEGDFTSDADIEQALTGCKVCFHLISTTLPKSSNADPLFDIETNLAGTLRLLQHAVKSGLSKIIFVSSGGTVYGAPQTVPIAESHPTDPISSYGITKLAIEKYLFLFHKLHGLEYNVLRLANPYGEGQRIHASQGAVAVFLGHAQSDEPIEVWGDGSVIRDYIYIGDVIDALLAALNYHGEQRLFNIGSGVGLSLNQVMDALERLLQRPVKRNYLPGRSFDVPASVLSIDMAKECLNWQPSVAFDEGLHRFAKWLELHPEN
jgi:UDP-glucose 4-epimerase